MKLFLLTSEHTFGGYKVTSTAVVRAETEGKARKLAVEHNEGDRKRWRAATIVELAQDGPAEIIVQDGD